MSLEVIKKNCPLFVENFPKDIKIYLFGSRAREAVAPQPANEDSDILDGIFEKAQDVDLLFEVDTKTFLHYQQECQNHSLNFFTDIPLDPHDYFWEYFSPKEIRLSAILKILKIDASMMTKIYEAFGYMGEIDIIILPFNWRKNKQIIQAINSYDRGFSRSLKKDAILLFEKNKVESPTPVCACGNGDNCCKNGGKIHADCKCKK